MTDHTTQLRIVRPRENLYYGLVSSKKVLKVKVQAFSAEKPVDDETFQSLLGKSKIRIFLDGSPVAVADHEKFIKATYTAAIDLSQVPDGAHSLQAVIQDEKSSAASPISNSSVSNIIIDRNLPTITAVMPSKGMKIEDRAFSRVLVEASGGGTGLYLKRCTAMIDQKIYKNPVEHKKGLVFLIPIPPKQGPHRLKLTIVDKAGNKSQRTIYFEIIEAAAQAEELDWQHRKGVVEEKLVSDSRFRRLLLTDARSAFAENGIPYLRAASSALPPPFPPAQADFFAGLNTDMASEKWDAMMKRATEDSPARNNARIAQIRERLGTSGPTTENGELTASAKDLVCEIMQNPQGFLESLGGTLLEDEKPYIFPSFSEVDATAFADWFSMTLTGQQPQPSEDRQLNLQEITNKISQDPVLFFRWLTQPAETYQELYPDATPRDIAFLPKPISPEEARRIVDSRSPTASIPTPSPTPHNSSDLVVGFSLPILNEFLGLFFTTLQQPRVFPKSFTSDYLSGLPAPYANIHCEVHLDQPGDLTVHDASADRISVTASGSASVTAEDGSQFSYSLALTPVYTILLKEDKVFLKFYSVGVEVTDQGSGISDADTAAAIKSFIETEVRNEYPDGEIYLVDQRPVNINIPFADVAVDIHRIWVHDDTDPGGSGELYFGIGIDGQEYLFGQIDADSGSMIEISRRFMLKKAGNSFPVQIQGIDMDLGVWPDVDDPLGGSMRMHSLATPGTYTLRGVTPVTSYELVWDIVEGVLRFLCWLVEALVWLFNFFFGWLGVRLEVHCTSWVENIMGWVRKAHTVDVHTYTLEYSVVPLSPVTTSVSLSKHEISGNALYLSFDFSIPEIGDLLAQKTGAVGFVGSSDFGVALSENLINKIISGWWHYSALPKRVTTPYGNRLLYAHVDLDQPRIALNSGSIGLGLAAAGVAGTNLGPAHITLGLPSGVAGLVLLTQEGRNLVFKIDKIWFLGDNLVTFLANLITHFAYNFSFFGEQLIDKQTIVMDLASSLRFGVQGAEYELNPTAPVQVKDAELIMKFSTVIAPSIRVEPSQLDFFLEPVLSFKIGNAGNEMLTITRMEFTDGIFQLVNPPGLPLNIPPGQEEILAVKVEDSWTDLHTAKLLMNNNDPAKPIAEVTLIALDKPIIQVVPEMIVLNQNFGSQEIIITNKGHVDLHLTDMVITDKFFSSPQVPSTADQHFPGATIAPAQEYRTTINIDVNKLDGTRSPSGYLNIYHDDLSKPNPISVLLSAIYYSSGGGSQSGGGGDYQ